MTKHFINGVAIGMVVMIVLLFCIVKDANSSKINTETTKETK